MYEEIAAEFMLHEGEVVFRDQCDLLDEFTVADLADQLVAVWAERIGEVDFERLITAFAKLRSEDGATGPASITDAWSAFDVDLAALDR